MLDNSADSNNYRQFALAYCDNYVNQRFANMLSAIEKLPAVDYGAVAPAEFAAAQQELRSLAKPPVRPQRHPTLMRKGSSMTRTTTLGRPNSISELILSWSVAGNGSGGSR